MTVPNRRRALQEMDAAIMASASCWEERQKAEESQRAIEDVVRHCETKSAAAGERLRKSERRYRAAVLGHEWNEDSGQSYKVTR